LPRHSIALLVWLQLAAWPAHALSPVTLDVSIVAGIYRVKFEALLDAPVENVARVLTDYIGYVSLDPRIRSSEVVGTAPDGVPLVASPGAGKVLEFLSAVLIYDYAGAGYGGGDPLTINYAGGVPLSSAVAAADSLGASGDKIVQFVPLAVAANVMTAATGLNLVTASGTDWTLGSATGVARVKVVYRIHTTGLA
jgi:hypothetical protein